MTSVILEIAKKETISYYSQKSAWLRNILFLLMFSILTISSVNNSLGQYGHASTNLFGALNVLVPLAAIFPVTMAGGLSIMAFPAERDQKTMEHLLSLPLTNRQIFLGKFLAAVVTGLVGLVLILAIVIGYLLMTTHITWDVPLFNSWVDAFCLMVFVIAPMLVVLLILSTVVISSRISSRELYVVNIVSMFVLMGLNVAVVTLNIDVLTFNEGLIVVFAAAIAIAYLLGTRLFSRESLIKSL